MNRLLWHLATGVENCPREEWLEIAPSVSTPERLAALISKRDPLGDVRFQGIDVFFVAAYAVQPEPPSLIYFWTPDFGDLSYANPRPGICLDDLINVAMMLGSVAASARPNLLGFRKAFEAALKPLFKGNKKFLDDKHLYWVPCGNILFVALFEEAGASQAVSSTSILDCIGLHSDYFHIKSPVWNSVPMSYLFGRVQKKPELVAKVLLDPKCFYPFEPAPPGWFLWPWQRSLCAASTGDVQYSPIETASLVFDLRKSTMALEQLRDEDVGHFSGFIKQVVLAAKKAVLSEGGFFDKETGDGIVAHFCDFDLPGAEMEPAAVRAFNASRNLIQAVHDICDEFQQRLNMGVGGLGASVGIHSGKAVWICEKNLVSAYGESVILAARLCSEAEIGAIFVSNHLFQRLAANVSAATVSRFDRQNYRGKEFNEASQLFGYQMRVRSQAAAGSCDRRGR